MNSRYFKIIAASCLMFVMSLVQAKIPVWTFTPLTATTVVIGPNQTATVQYSVTNQSRKTHTLLMNTIPGLTQMSGGPGICPHPIVLAYNQSCVLSLSIDGSAIPQDIHGGPVLCEHGNPNLCYQPARSNILEIIKGPAEDYTVGGSVFGLIGTLVLENNAADPLTMTADGSFTFSIALPTGSPYQVTVQTQPLTQICTVTNNTGTITNSNITDVNVNCSVSTRTVGGTISGLTASSVVLQNNGTDNLTVNSNGSFTFTTPIAQGSPYDVTVFTQPDTQTCTVTNGSGTAGATNITDVQVTCATNAYSIGGTVSGLSGNLVLQNNSADDLFLNSNGAFTFSTDVAQGATYNVTVSTQPAGQLCTVSNGSGTMGGSNVTNVSVSCQAASTSLSVSISDLALSVTGLTEYGVTGTPSSGLARVISILNTGSSPTENLLVSMPVLPTGTLSSNDCGPVLAPGGTCTITITPGSIATSDGTNPCTAGTAPVPGLIQISADNATTVSSNVVILGYGCVYQSGYVFALDDTTVNTGSVGGKVATTTDQAAPYPNGVIWASNGGTGGGSGGNDSQDTSFDLLPGIAETSTSSLGVPAYSSFATYFASNYTNPNPFTSASFFMCNGGTDGSCNTANIQTFYHQFITHNTAAIGGSAPYTATPGPTNINYYASGLCKQTISGFFDWYLPAICEMGYEVAFSCGTAITPTTQNLQSSLVDFNSLNLLEGTYWSSSIWSINPQFNAFSQIFASGGASSQTPDAMSKLLGVRCVRALS